MFESLSDRLTGVLQGLRGKGRLTDADIDATTREIRLALLEADVSLPVVREFVARIKERAKGAKTATPARSPTICSWLTAPGRCRSHATSSGVCPCPRSHLASLPARVVLPEPCRPASMITVGGVLANASWRVSPPRIPMSSSLTILTTCWAGLSAPETSAPLARSLIRLTNSRTTAARHRPRAAPAGSHGWSHRYRRRSAAPCRAAPTGHRSTGRTGIQTRGKPSCASDTGFAGGGAPAAPRTGRGSSPVRAAGPSSVATPDPALAPRCRTRRPPTSPAW